MRRLLARPVPVRLRVRLRRRAAAQLRAPGSNQPLHAFEVVEDGRIRRLESG